MKVSAIARQQPARRAVFAMAAIVLVGSISAGARQSAVAKPTVDKSVKVGTGVYEVVAGADAIYVASAGGRGGPAAAKVVALNPTTLDAVKTIELTEAAYGLGLNEKTHKLYTSNTRAGSMSVIDLKTGSVVATIKSEADPQAHLFRVLVDEATDTVYASLAGKDGKIWIIDGKTDKLVHTITNVGVTPTGLALDKAANRLYTAVLGANEIAAIDLKTREVVTRFPAGGERPTQLAFDASTSRLFITNQATGALTVVDTKSGQLLQTVKTGAGALGVGFNPRTNRIYVANRGAGTVTVIDGKTYETVADLTVGTLPNTIAVDARTNATYVTSKARGGPRGAPPVDDPNGDTVTLIKQ